MKPLVPSLLVLAACGTIGLDRNDDSGAVSDSGEPAPVRIDALDPAWGPTDGGTEVTVTGAGFEGEVAFWFGGTAVDVTVINAATLFVSSPEAHVEAAVDVRVTSDLGEATLADGFVYSDTGPPDTGGGDDTGSGSNAGKVTGLVELDYIAVACPSCFGLSTNLMVDGYGFFHEPASGSWSDWMPPAGSCELNPGRSELASHGLDVGSHVYLEYSSSLSIDLQRQGDDSYAFSGLGQDDYVKNASFDLSVPDGGDWGPFTADGALRTSSSITSLSPVGLFLDNPNAFGPLSASAATFTWAPTGVSDAVVIDIIVFNPAGTVKLGEIFCVSDDTGSATVPSSAFGGFSAGDPAAVYFYRFEMSETTNPVDGSTIEGTSAFGALGTATLVP